ncbi:hypothetical protein [Clostridium sp.]|uniref:hypothetical protein n=1 Tax=Clostridium sp. TaxID=1506 RepID=UPI003F3591A7
MKEEKNKSNKNLTVTHELVSDCNKTYVSEVQTFKVPEDYEDAFKKYYPKE